MKRWKTGAFYCAMFLLAMAGGACGNRVPETSSLIVLADKYGTDKGNRVHHFADTYELFFGPIRSETRKAFEIGVLEGASLRMWSEYFPNAKIFGIDIEDKSFLNSDRIATFIADQADRRQLQSFLDRAGGNFDIIIDDGGHSMEQQQVSLGYLFRHVKPGGYYVIEDVHTSIYEMYQNRYGALPTGENTTLALIDNFVRTGNIESLYMTAEEKDYVQSAVVYANLLSRDRGRSISCIFKKTPSSARKKTA